MKVEKPKEKYDQLIADGYCVVADVLKEEMLTQLRTVTDELLDAQTEDQREAYRSSGSMISVYMHSLFAELVVYPRTLEALETLGFLRPKWSSGYVISKPPQSPPLFWHQDWWGWNDPCSYTALPQQLFLMYYLVDTTPYNGCLRVIKGSHLNRHLLHDILPDAHGEALQRVDDANHPAYQHFSGEVDIPVKAGDLVIGDSRLLHASHGNQSDERRTVITLWYHPFFALLPAPMQAHIGRLRQRLAWSEADWKRIAEIAPVCKSDVEPLKWNRNPGPELK
ncbi:MAG: phytanoyl-CoA dioxygenase family protein [Candidatus Poribacteria bacterium]|nr:phytanoyl-CoA dioxygenase family protein [Candidatus Poribacteria bacterium]